MSITHAEGVRERLLAYIAPRKPETIMQTNAMNSATEAQVDYEVANGLLNIPGNVISVTNDGVSMAFAVGSAAPAYTRDTICPVAWSLLRNAGLIAYNLPTAKKP